MASIYFFGDSYTYGYGLPDCVVYDEKLNHYFPGPVHSQFVWTNIVAANLGLNHVNLSRCGTSNMRMHIDIRNQMFEPDDIAVVQWSFSPRCFILDDSMQEVNNWNETDTSRNFFMVHTDIDLERRSLMIIEHTDLLMRQKGIRYAAFANKPFEPVMNIVSEILGYHDHCRIGGESYTGHPDIKSNQMWAAQVTAILKQKFGI